MKPCAPSCAAPRRIPGAVFPQAIPQQLDVARVFGDQDKAKGFFPRLEGYSAVEKIEAKTGGYKKAADQWHADITWSSNPPTAGLDLLRARLIAPA